MRMRLFSIHHAGGEYAVGSACRNHLFSYVGKDKKTMGIIDILCHYRHLWILSANDSRMSCSGSDRYVDRNEDRGDE